MADTTRRHFLVGSAALPLSGLALSPAASANETLSMLRADLDRYIGFGNKQTGGPGDQACGKWMESELIQAGYAVERLPFSAPWFEPQQCEISVGTVTASVWPQPIVRTTDAMGITAPLVRVDRQGQAARPLKDAIALIDLPYGRWSSALARPVRAPVEAAFAAGARAAVLVTNGPTGQVIALNADGRKPMFNGPTALLAPAEAQPFFAAAMNGESARLVLTGRGGQRPAFNMVGRLERGDRPWIVVSTPRSGWFTCAGERGGGIAAWLMLARWAPAALPGYNLAFLCNSGHEYEYLGAQESLKAATPRPDRTAFWLHLGANVAARDWHEGLFGLEPLSGADSQRYLVVSEPLLATAKRQFKGLAGLEDAYPTSKFTAGELSEIVKAGYSSVAGVFGLHRYHHVAQDDARCVTVETVAAAATAFRNLLASVAAG